MGRRGLAGAMLRAVGFEKDGIGPGHPSGQAGRLGQLAVFGGRTRHGIGPGLPEGIPHGLIGGVIRTGALDMGGGGDQHPLPLGGAEAGHPVEKRCLSAAPHEGDDVALLPQEGQRFEAVHQTSPACSATAMATFSGVMGSS